MTWFVIIMVVLAIAGAISQASDKDKEKKAAEEKLLEAQERAKKAREAILASGNQELIDKLHLMEAGHGSRFESAPPVSQVNNDGLRTAAAVVGGVIIADAITTEMHLAALENALGEMDESLASATDGLDDAFDLSDIFNG